MIGRHGNGSNNPLGKLVLPPNVEAQTLKLLGHIAQASSKGECERAADRAEGFVLGMETVRALNASSIEGLYLAFEHTATARLLELEQ